MSIKLVVTDCDGSLTDGTIFYDSTGPVGRRYSAFDGKGFELLLKAGIHVIIVTQSGGVSAQDIKRRAERFGIPSYTGVHDKKGLIDNLLLQNNYIDIEWKNVAYFGDDINDLEPMKEAELVGCPPSAHWIIEGYVDSRKAHGYVAGRPAGNGAFRDFADYVIGYNNIEKHREVEQ